MGTWALLSAFLSGVAWSGLDIARKSLARDLAASVAATGLTLGVAVLFGAWLLLFPPTLRLGDYAGPASVSVVLGTGIQLLIIESVRRSELSRTIPLLSFTPVATALFGAIVLDERPSGAQWLGIALVFVGALGLGLSRSPGGHAGTRRGRTSFDSGSAMMLGAALLISATAPFDKLAVGASTPAWHGFVQSLGVGVILLGFLGLRGEAGAVMRALASRRGLSFGAVLAVAAIGFQFSAYRGAMVGTVETVKRVVGLVGSLLAGSVVFGERITASKLISLLLMGAGVTMMLLGGDA